MSVDVSFPTVDPDFLRGFFEHLKAHGETCLECKSNLDEFSKMTFAVRGI